MWKCPSCKFTKPVDAFPKRIKVSKCNDCIAKDRKKDRNDMRAAVLRTLGSTCVCCGEIEQVFLDIDHINNDGWKDRKETSYVTWRLAFKEPERFQLLCRNCNWAKHMGGCPHQKRR
jgi:hypothetical protein